MIKEIMYCNKDMATGTIKINMDGIMELTFENDNLKSIYYVIAKEV
jgi:phenylalanine-4-hydroxylase